jgi:hypothetical protein
MHRFPILKQNDSQVFAPCLVYRSPSPNSTVLLHDLLFWTIDDPRNPFKLDNFPIRAAMHRTKVLREFHNKPRSPDDAQPNPGEWSREGFRMS